MKAISALTTLAAVQKWDADPDRAAGDAARLRWRGRVRCPTCGAADPYWFETRRVYCCRKTHPRRQFTVKSGTILADSAIPIGTWLTAIWMLSRGRVTSYALADTLKLTQKSAWALLHRIEMAAGAITGRPQAFDRLARRILTATPADVAARERVYQRRQKRRRERLAALTQLTDNRGADQV